MTVILEWLLTRYVAVSTIIDKRPVPGGSVTTLPTDYSGSEAASSCWRSQARDTAAGLSPRPLLMSRTSEGPRVPVNARVPARHKFGSGGNAACVARHLTPRCNGRNPGVVTPPLSRTGVQHRGDSRDTAAPGSRR